MISIEYVLNAPVEKLEMIKFHCENGETLVHIDTISTLFHLSFEEIKGELTPDNIKHYDDLICPLALGPFKCFRVNDKSYFIRPRALLNILTNPNFNIPNCPAVRQYLSTTFPEANTTTLNRDSQLKQAFEALARVMSTKDLKGNATHMSYQHFSEAWYALSQLASTTGLGWVGSFIRDVSEFPYEKTYKLFDLYQPYIAQYELITLVSKLIMFQHSRIVFDNKERGRVDTKMVNITSHRLPDSNPLYALSYKQLHIPCKSKRPVKERDLIVAKMKVQNSNGLHRVDVPIINSELPKYPSFETFELNNAGDLFKTFYTTMRVKVLFLLEMSNREVMKKSGTVVNLDVTN